MKKKSMNIRNYVLFLFLILFATANLFAKSVISREAVQVKKCKLSLVLKSGKTAVLSMQHEQPKLSEKSSTVDGNKLIVTYNISLVNDAVLKALDEIKNTNKPGSFIAYEFYVFEVNRTTATLKIELGKGSVNLLELLKFLQTSLDNSLKTLQ